MRKVSLWLSVISGIALTAFIATVLPDRVPIRYGISGEAAA